MRIRFKPWARPELEASYFYEDNPEEYIGKWKQKFKNKENELHIESNTGIPILVKIIISITVKTK